METINMRQEELQELVEAVSLQHFNRAFQHEARFNSRLRTTGGRYLLSSHDLEFNPKQLAWHGKEELIQIIKHELCHYHLHLQGKGYHHRDPEFKQLLKRVGGSRYCSNIPGTRNRETVKHCYECKSCGHRYYRRRRMNTDRYVCGGCKGRLRKIQLKY